jgi:hypothetical protein
MTCWSEPLILRLRGPDSPRRMTDARAYGEGHGKRMPDPRGDGSPRRELTHLRRAAHDEMSLDVGIPKKLSPPADA